MPWEAHEVSSPYQAEPQGIEMLFETNGLRLKKDTLDNIQKQLAGISALNSNLTCILEAAYSWWREDQHPASLRCTGQVSCSDIPCFLARASEHLSEGGTFAFETRNLDGKNDGNSSDYTLWRSFQDPAERWIDVWVASRFDVHTHIDHVQLVRKVRQTGETWPSQIDLRYIGIEELNQRLAEHDLTVVAQYGDWTKTPHTASSPEISAVCHR
jgi:hypothetical protein